jgi:hypothetical protein
MYYTNENFVYNQGTYYNYFLIASGLYVLYLLLDCLGILGGGGGGGNSCCVPCDAAGQPLV